MYMYMYMPLTLYGCYFWQACNTPHFSTIKFITVLTHARRQEKMRRDGKSLACKASMTQVRHYRYNKQQIFNHSLFLKISFNNTYISAEPLLLLLIKEVSGIQSTRRRTNLLTPTRRRIKSSRNMGELVLSPIQLIRS